MGQQSSLQCLPWVGPFLHQPFTSFLQLLNSLTSREQRDFSYCRLSWTFWYEPMPQIFTHASFRIVIFAQLSTFLRVEALLSHYQQGIRQHRSTGDLLGLSHSWLAALDNHGETQWISQHFWGIQSSLSRVSSATSQADLRLPRFVPTIFCYCTFISPATNFSSIHSFCRYYYTIFSFTTFYHTNTGNNFNRTLRPYSAIDTQRKFNSSKNSFPSFIEMAFVFLRSAFNLTKLPPTICASVS